MEWHLFSLDSQNKHVGRSRMINIYLVGLYEGIASNQEFEFEFELRTISFEHYILQGA